MSSMSKVFKSLNGVKRTFTSANQCLRSKNKRTYEDAIIALNSLQPNAVELNKSIQARQQQKHDDANLNLSETEKFLERIDGFSMTSLAQLSVIHVAGSKGKGSVCTYTEAILRHHNVKTGLFTSPHLVSVTERIKLRGGSISKQLFNDYFWEVYDALQLKKDNERDLPSYFKFLQIMAFYIFVRENVDVAIVEVGIGGEFDSTNIVRNTEIVGITSLQLEHSQLLGETIEEIAWQKAGIIKEASHVFAMPQQQPACLRVITERFHEKKGKSLSVAPAFEDYEWMKSVPDFKQTSEVNKLNFSLAAQLSARWLRSRNKLSNDVFNGDVLRAIDNNFVDAFNKCQFEGRFQRIERDGLTYFLDGAHTKDSMEICTEWFVQQVKNSEDINILVFNVTGDRDSALILRSLHFINFKHVCFATNISNKASDNGKCENYSGILGNVQLDRCIAHKEIWKSMGNESQISICPTIQEALDVIHDIKDNNNSATINVLFTGSLHLVGGALRLLNSEAEVKAVETAVKIKRLRS